LAGADGTKVQQISKPVKYNLITLNSLEQEHKLFHEMLHKYQHKDTTTNAFVQNFGNLEVESQIATAIYALSDRIAASDPERFNRNANELAADGFHYEAMQLASKLDSNGMLISGNTIIGFNNKFYDLANAIKATNSKYVVNYSLSFYDNLRKIHELLLNC
jgi:hypothetical protein